MLADLIVAHSFLAGFPFLAFAAKEAFGSGRAVPPTAAAICSNPVGWGCLDAQLIFGPADRQPRHWGGIAGALVYFVPVPHCWPGVATRLTDRSWLSTGLPVTRRPLR